MKPHHPINNELLRIVRPTHLLTAAHSKQPMSIEMREELYEIGTCLRACVCARSHVCVCVCACCDDTLTEELLVNHEAGNRKRPEQLNPLTGSQVDEKRSTR
jgi:hypothetical protein